MNFGRQQPRLATEQTEERGGAGSMTGSCASGAHVASQKPPDYPSHREFESRTSPTAFVV